MIVRDLDLYTSLAARNLVRTAVSVTTLDRKLARVMSLARQMRGGKDYDPEWRARMRGQGPIAVLMAARFKAARKCLGLERERLSLDVGTFRVPSKAGDQTDLFRT